MRNKELVLAVSFGLLILVGAVPGVARGELDQQALRGSEQTAPPSESDPHHPALHQADFAAGRFGEDAVSVLTFNVHLKPDAGGSDVRLPKSIRTEPIAELILEAGADIVVLQEAFSDSHRQDIRESIESRYPHRSRILGRDSGLEQDGGVIVFSKYPIERQMELIYEDCASWDCKADKGILYTRISIGGKPLHLLATHLQAGSAADRHSIRLKQLGVIKSLIEVMEIPKTQPLLLAGDLNVDRCHRSRHRQLLDSLNMGDPSLGSLVDATTISVSDPSYLDYVLYSNRHLIPRTSSVRSIDVEYHGSVPAWVKRPPWRPWIHREGPWYLSDHLPILATFSFSGWEALPTNTFPYADFYEGNGGTEQFQCSVVLRPNRGFRFSHQKNCSNDEARSARLYDLDDGLTLRLFDSPSASKDDDWVQIVATESKLSGLIGSFEEDLTGDSGFAMSYHRNNGLDGKISYLQIDDEPVATFDFHEGGGGTQNLVCGIEPVNGFHRFRHGITADCDNDEARSVTLHYVPKGTHLRVFDSRNSNSERRMEDDWFELRLHQDVQNLTVNDFESDLNSLTVSGRYLRNNGLNGKVSSIQVFRANDFEGIVSLYEGHGGGQNKVCDLVADRSSQVNFKNNGACDNDEARSMVLRHAKRGTLVKVHDSPSCSTGDDYMTIRVKRRRERIVVQGFEKSRNTADFESVYHRKNGLNGKVSCVAIEEP